MSQPSHTHDIASSLALWALNNWSWSVQRDLTWQKDTCVFIVFTVVAIP